jgi:hypothetical protein
MGRGGIIRRAKWAAHGPCRSIRKSETPERGGRDGMCDLLRYVCYMEMSLNRGYLVQLSSLHLWSLGKVDNRCDLPWKARNNVVGRGLLSFSLTR